MCAEFQSRLGRMQKNSAGWPMTSLNLTNEYVKKGLRYGWRVQHLRRIKEAHYFHSFWLSVIYSNTFSLLASAT